MDYLVMRLYAPLSSWGTLAVGEDRPTVNYPTRSAVLGLLGAALGIKRSETQKLKDLADSIGMASKTYSEGTILRDYHTIQTPTASKGVKFFTRKQELQSPKVETILSSRDYREDGLWVVAVWMKPATNRNDFEYKFDLAQLQQALKYPTFTLYIGRKSCPLSLPLSPQLITADNLKLALDISIDDLTKQDLKDEVQNPINNAKAVPHWRVNELLDTMVSDHWLPTTIDYSAVNSYKADNNEVSSRVDNNNDQIDRRLRQVTYHWEGAIDMMFGESNAPVNVFTHSHWDEPINRKQWQFTQRIGHQWTTLESVYQSPTIDFNEPLSSQFKQLDIRLNNASKLLSATDGTL